MAVITVPDFIGFEGADIALVRATRVLRSPLTGRRQVVKSAYALWQFTGTMVALQGAVAGAVRSFLAELEGRANTFRLPVPGSETPLSGYDGTAGLVNGSGQLGYSVITDGWAPNRMLFRKGDYFNIGDELKLSSVDVTSDGSGNATLVFQPPMRRAPANNAAITYLNPFIYLAAEEDDVAKWGLKDYNTHTVKITCTEAVE